MSVASKNLFDLLGENDGEEVAPPPKTNARTAAKVDAKAGPRRGVSGNETAFRDRNVGSVSNRGKSTDDSYRGTPRGGSGARVRGGRGSGHPRNRDDRHSKNLASGSEKQAAHSWGGAEGDAELKDEQAGEEIAKTEKKDDEGEGERKDSAEVAEPEERQISLEDYRAQQAEKKLNLETEVNLRRPNEGAAVDKKWANAQPLVKAEDEVYFEGTGGGKAKRERERKSKVLIDIDQRFVEPDRGGRGGSRGGRGHRGGGRGGDFRSDSHRDIRGESRGGGGGRGGGEFRGRGGGGEFRGRGAPRGSRGRGGPSGGSDSTPINPQDQSAFPSLGA